LYLKKAKIDDSSLNFDIITQHDQKHSLSSNNKSEFLIRLALVLRTWDLWTFIWY